MQWMQYINGCSAVLSCAGTGSMSPVRQGIWPQASGPICRILSVTGVLTHAGLNHVLQ